MESSSGTPATSALERSPGSAHSNQQQRRSDQEVPVSSMGLCANLCWADCTDAILTLGLPVLD